MAFNIGNFNEKNMVGESMSLVAGAATNAANSGIDRMLLAQKRMQTISTTATGVNRWFGFSAAEYQQRHSEIFALGQILRANYFVDFEPYNGNNTANLPMFYDRLSGFLVTETNLPLLNAEFDTVKIGPFYANHINAFSEPDIQMTLIETAEGRFVNSLQSWRDLMVNDDGTMNPPASYAMRLTIGMFSKDFGMAVKPISRTFIVAPTVSMLDGLAGTAVSEVLDIPVSFTILRNFME